MDLLKQKCVPCEGGVAPMDSSLAKAYMKRISLTWKLSNNNFSIVQSIVFKDFNESMQFVNTVAAIAEEAGHHPDISISYNKVILTLTTHAIKGLSVNDFIVAANIDAIKKR